MSILTVCNLFICYNCSLPIDRSWQVSDRASDIVIGKWNLPAKPSSSCARAQWCKCRFIWLDYPYFTDTNKSIDPIYRFLLIVDVFYFYLYLHALVCLTTTSAAWPLLVMLDPVRRSQDSDTVFGVSLGLLRASGHTWRGMICIVWVCFGVSLGLLRATMHTWRGII
jgi:hypothetical protein